MDYDCVVTAFGEQPTLRSSGTCALVPAPEYPLHHQHWCLLHCLDMRVLRADNVARDGGVCVAVSFERGIGPLLEHTPQSPIRVALALLDHARSSNDDAEPNRFPHSPLTPPLLSVVAPPQAV